MLVLNIINFIIWSKVLNIKNNKEIRDYYLNNNEIKDYLWNNKYLNRLGIILLLYILLININISNIEYINITNYMYNNMFILTNYRNLIIILILIISIIYLFLLSFRVTTINIIDKIIISKELLIVLILFNILGLILLILVNDLILLFIIIELQSYSLYLITCIYNESNNSIKGGLYYFIVGSIGSFIILDGTVSIYEDIGLTYINNIIMFIESINLYDWLIILFGLFIKIGLAPFFNYSIVLYTLAPTLITNYISLMPKLSILILIFNIVNIINISNSYINYNINYIISIIILLSMIIGSIGGLNVIKLKTLLAYSSLLNVSYMLLAIISYNEDSIQSLLFYLWQYSYTHLNIFTILLVLPLYLNINLLNNNNNNNNNNKNNNNNILLSIYSPIEYISQLHNLYLKNVYLFICLSISIFSLIGIPPLIGFYGKLLILISSLNSGYIILSILLIVVSTISVVYYANILKELGFSILTTKINNNEEINTDINIEVDNKLNMNKYKNNGISYIISVLTLIILCIIILYEDIIRGTYICVNSIYTII